MTVEPPTATTHAYEHPDDGGPGSSQTSTLSPTAQLYVSQGYGGGGEGSGGGIGGEGESTALQTMPPSAALLPVCSLGWYQAC